MLHWRQMMFSIVWNDEPWVAIGMCSVRLRCCYCAEWMADFTLWAWPVECKTVKLLYSAYCIHELQYCMVWCISLASPPYDSRDLMWRFVDSCTDFWHEERMRSSTRSCWRGYLWAKTTDLHCQLPDWLVSVTQSALLCQGQKMAKRLNVVSKLCRFIRFFL